MGGSGDNKGDSVEVPTVPIQRHALHSQSRVGPPPPKIHSHGGSGEMSRWQWLSAMKRNTVLSSQKNSKYVSKQILNMGDLMMINAILTKYK